MRSLQIAHTADGSGRQQQQRQQSGGSAESSPLLSQAPQRPQSSAGQRRQQQPDRGSSGASSSGSRSFQAGSGRSPAGGGPTGDEEALDIVQFSASVFYLDEAEGTLDIDVMRLGSMQGRVAVSFYTEDGSAKEGIAYSSSSGRLVFEDGEAMQSFKLSVVPNDVWAPTLEFKVHLHKAESATIGTYLGMCRVKVISDECFPSDAYDKEEMELAGAHHIAGFSLWWEYFKLNMKQPGMSVRTIAVLLVDQLAVAYMYFTIAFNIYLVDVVFNKHGDTEDKLLIPGHRYDTAILMGIVWIIPNFLLHIWAYFKPFIGIKGKSQAFLQESLFRKYLNYSDKSRAEVLPSDMLVSIMQDCTTVADSYLCAMNMVTSAIKIMILANFIYRKNPKCLWIIIVMPSFMMTFAACRTHRQMRFLDAFRSKEISVMALANEVCSKFRLVADYAQRPRMNHKFCERTAGMRGAFRDNLLVTMNSDYFPVFLGVMFVGIFISKNSELVLEGEMSLGTFLATMNVFKEVSGAFGEIYAMYMTLTKAWEPLAELAVLYNKQTDLIPCKELHRYSRGRTKQDREELLRRRKKEGTPLEPGQFLTDLLEISMNDVAYKYSEEGELILQHASAIAAQGELIVITGRHGTGRATVMKLIGKVAFPVSGTVVMPTHLRVVHVGKDPLLLRMNMWENLTFGLTDPSLTNDMPRVKDILLKMEMGNIARLMDEQNDTTKHHEGDHIWQDKLTSTERAKIHLARAFIMNPEVLVFQRPLSNFNQEEQREMLKIFQDFVRHKGICFKDGMAKRRPRTLFFVPEAQEEAIEWADREWKVEARDGPGKKAVVKTMTVRDKPGKARRVGAAGSASHHNQASERGS